MHPFILCSSHCLLSNLLSIAHGWVVCATENPLDFADCYNYRGKVTIQDPSTFL